MFALIAFATTRSCSRAAGRYTSTETSIGRCPPFCSHAASFPAVVVLPDPCSPAIKITVGGRDANWNRATSLPKIAISSSRTIFTTCSVGDSEVITSCPIAFSRMCSISSFTTLRFTSASSSATRISRNASAMFSSVTDPCPRRFLNARCSLSVRFSNIVRSPVYRTRRHPVRRPNTT